MLAVSDGETAFAEKSGGILKIGQFDSPASMSILEESSNTAEGPMMGVFNNLVGTVNLASADCLKARWG
jgi:hypothetical protein